MKRLLLSLLAALALPTAVNAEIPQNNFQLNCTREEYFSNRSRSWVKSGTKFILLFETSRGIATERHPNLKNYMLLDTVYEIESTTRNSFKLVFFQPKNTYVRTIRIDRLTGQYSFYSGFLKEDEERGWSGTVEHKGNCIKTSIQEQLF